jgi:hypothetical protein
VETQSFWIWPAERGSLADKLVLCSDGLYSLVTEAEIAEAVSKLSPQEACAQLTERAKARGGFDNITLAVLPLEGQLREEAPAKPRSRITRRVPKAAEAPPLSWGARLAIVFFLALIGSVVTALMMLFRMSAS